MADPNQRPPTAPPPEDEEDEPRSNLPPEVADREAQRAIEEIEDEIEDERPSKPARPPPPAAEGDDKTLVAKAWEKQYQVEANLKRLGHGRYSRVLKMARKPEPEEYHKALQITAIGIMVIGFFGFLIYLFMQWVMGLLGVE